MVVVVVVTGGMIEYSERCYPDVAWSSDFQRLVVGVTRLRKS